MKKSWILGVVVLAFFSCAAVRAEEADTDTTLTAEKPKIVPEKKLNRVGDWITIVNFTDNTIMAKWQLGRIVDGVFVGSGWDTHSFRNIPDTLDDEGKVVKVGQKQWNLL